MDKLKKLYLCLLKSNKDKFYNYLANNLYLLNEQIINSFLGDFLSINNFLLYLKNDENRNKFLYNHYIFSILFGKNSCDYFLLSQYNSLNISFDDEANLLNLYKSLTKDSRVCLLKSFKNEDKIISYLINNNLEVNEKYLLKLVSSFKNKELLKKIINLIKDEGIKSNLIMLTNDLSFISNNLYDLTEDDLDKYYSLLPSKDIMKIIDNSGNKIDYITYLKDEDTIIKVFDSLSLKEKMTLLLNPNFNDLLMVKLYLKVSEYDVNSKVLFRLLEIIKNEKARQILVNNTRISEIDDLIDINNTNKEVLLNNQNISFLNINLNKDLTFGVELEMINKYVDIYKEFENFVGNWKFKREYSIKNGMEINSPILKYNINSLKELKLVCDYFSKNEYLITEDCGGHIHIGFNVFKSTKELMNLYLIYLNAEEIFYYISNKKGSIIRNGIKFHAYPMSYIFNKKINNINDNIKLASFVNIIKSLQKDRGAGINIQNVNDYAKNTIEFRVPNMEINYNELIFNILLYLSLVTKAVASANEKKDSKNNVLIKELIENESNDVKIRILLDLLFDDDKLKNIYYERYYSNKLINDENDYFMNNTSKVKF